MYTAEESNEDTLKVLMQGSDDKKVIDLKNDIEAKKMGQSSFVRQSSILSGVEQQNSAQGAPS